MTRRQGFSLVETLVALGLVALVAAMVLPDFTEVRRRTDLVRLARQIAADALRCRLEAITSGRNVGLVFCELDGLAYYVMVADGDHDGVSRADFVRGIDKPLGPKIWVHFMSGGTHLGVPSGWAVPDPSGDGTLNERGVRVGSSNIMSFAHTGGATPSSVYFNDGRDRVLAVRVHGGLGRVRVLLWRQSEGKWREVQL
jgi:prepilin-type N-terminal cleavage/methylation domain-containing protein